MICKPIAKQLQALPRAELVRSVVGPSRGYVLGRSPERITVLDVVKAIDGPGPAFVCTEIRQRGPMATPPEACTAPCAIAAAMASAESAWREALWAVTIADLARQVEAGYGEGALARIGAWPRPGGAPEE
ncbi:transcriptional regulator [Streptomyces sp. PT12]|nr:transcriptional regulator [Streptomyces sp. PT12]